MTAHESFDPIRSIQDLVAVVDRSRADFSRAHRRLWFRGEPRDCWDLTPKVYRSDFKVVENEISPDVERFLNEDFRMQSAGIRSGKEDDAELYFLQQHYGLPTRLLDWSTIPLIALYFALGDANGRDDTSDGKLYIMKNMSEVVSSRNNEFQDFITWLNWREPQNRIPERIIAVRPNHFDRRVALQRACFTVHPSKHRTFEESRFELRFVKIDQGCKPKMREDLALLGIDDFTVYGDLDHLARTLKDRYILRS